MVINQLPNDLSITVEDCPAQLLELLWIREAYALHPEGKDLPPVLSDSPLVVRDSAVDVGQWSLAWPHIWQAAVAHVGGDIDLAPLYDEAQRTEVGSPERLSILRRMRGASWRDDFGDAAFETDSYREWSTRMSDVLRAARRGGHQPDVSSLISAWRAGLKAVILIPCEGFYAQRIGPGALLMSIGMRLDEDGFKSALDNFI